MVLCIELFIMIPMFAIKLEWRSKLDFVMYMVQSMSSAQGGLMGIFYIQILKDL